MTACLSKFVAFSGEQMELSDVGGSQTLLDELSPQL